MPSSTLGLLLALCLDQDHPLSLRDRIWVSFMCELVDVITEWSQCSCGYQKHCFIFSWCLLLLELLTTTKSGTSFFLSLSLLCEPAQNTQLQTHHRGLNWLANHPSIQHLYIYLSFYLPIYPSSIPLFIHPLSVHQPIHHLSLSICPSIHLSLYTSIHLTLYHSTIHQSIPLFIHPSVYLSIHLSPDSGADMAGAFLGPFLIILKLGWGLRSKVWPHLETSS